MPSKSVNPPVLRHLTPYLAFAAFGVFWGSWGALLPAIRGQAGLTGGQLGVALLFVGLGALPTMLLTGRLTDRFGTRMSACCLALLSATAVILGVAARGPTSAVVCMLFVGATSGAADVAINALAGEAEHRTLRPVLARAHGAFSAAVVVSSLATGAFGLLDASLATSMCIAATTGLMLSFLVWRGTSSLDARPREARTPLALANPAPTISTVRTSIPFVALGVVGALAYATENAHQSWGAVVITDVFSSPDLAALAPATFAGTAAVTRLVLAPLSRSHPALVLTGGGVVAMAGTVALATAPSVTIVLGALAVAAAGTAMLFPTLLSQGLRSVPTESIGASTSIVATTAYLGYLAGPAFVGLISDQVGIRAAFYGVAVLILVFALTAALTGRWAGKTGDYPKSGHPLPKIEQATGTAN